jgi:Tfp pilus assembly protein PilW
MLRLRTLVDLGHDERGFTLVETLVAMVCGLVVSAALFAILEVSLHQTARLTDVAQASQLGRTTMTRIVDELHSACIAPGSTGYTPVQEGSNANELIVINAYSANSEITTAREDKIVWNAAAKTLTDYTRVSSAESAWPKFVFTAAWPSTGTIIGEGVTQTENAKKEAIPIFTYYKYATEASASSAAASSTLAESEPLTGTLKKEVAETVASVLVSFRTAPTAGAGAGSRTIQTKANSDFTSQVTFAFSAPGTETTIVDGPCR